jgi:hypothetical protein
MNGTSGRISRVEVRWTFEELVVLYWRTLRKLPPSLCNALAYFHGLDFQRPQILSFGKILFRLVSQSCISHFVMDSTPASNIERTPLPVDEASPGRLSKIRVVPMARHRFFDSLYGAGFYPGGLLGGDESGFGPLRVTKRPGGPHSGKGPRNYRRPDERVREDVCELLTKHPDIDGSEIEVSVDRGVVTLNGSVPDRRMKRLAEDIADCVFGVVDIDNHLGVSLRRRDPSPADTY